MNLRGLFSFVLGGVILFVLFSQTVQSGGVSESGILPFLMATVGFLLVGIGIALIAKNEKTQTK